MSSSVRHRSHHETRHRNFGHVAGFDGGCLCFQSFQSLAAEWHVIFRFSGYSQFPDRFMDVWAPFTQIVTSDLLRFDCWCFLCGWAVITITWALGPNLSTNLFQIVGHCGRAVSNGVAMFLVLYFETLF